MTHRDFWDNRRVVVPGGAGFIGSHVCEQLAMLGAKVTAIDHLGSGSWDRLRDAPASIRRVEADVTDPASWSHFSGADVVMNLAGVAPGLTEAPDRHEALYQANIRVGEAVQSAVLAHRVPRFLMVSSSCVYPDDAPVPTPELDLTDTLPEAANHGYGMAKRALETAALEATAAHRGLSVAIVRPFNVFGGRDLRTGPGAHVIPALLEKLFSPDPQLIVWGSGRQTRSFTHAADVARAMILITERHHGNEPVNIGRGEEITMRELVDSLMHLTGIRKPVVFDTTKPEGAARKACDARYLRQVTGGFSPAISHEQGLQEITRRFAQRTKVVRISKSSSS